MTLGMVKPSEVLPPGSETEPSGWLELAQPGVEGKLARYLLANGGSSCPATELCQRLGVSRASLYRAFAALEDSGLIVREGKTITVVDPAGLETVL